MTENEAYEEKRRQAIDNLKKLGLKSIPLSVAATVLPIIPEWEKFQKKRKRKKKKTK